MAFATVVVERGIFFYDTQHEPPKSLAALRVGMRLGCLAQGKHLQRKEE